MDPVGENGLESVPCPTASEASSSKPRSEKSELSVLERSTWQGWAELENDPNIFSTLLTEWGVKGIEVREIVPLDAIFDTPASATYGLILLSRYVSRVHSEISDEADEVPEDLWFANQTSSFSCATVALMNIICNRPDVDLGKRLNDFRSATKTLSPKDRGHELDQFDHVKSVHNSFASDFDLMNVDMRLKEDATEAARKKAAKSKKSRKRKKPAEDEEVDNGFHFVAYVPACNQIWRMDGMERNPQSLGTIVKDENWITMIISDIQSQWESATLNQLEFSLLSLVAGSDRVSLAAGAERMNRAREDWSPFIAHLLRLHAKKGDIGASLV